MSLSLLLPVIHNQLLCFADVEMEVVILAPRCQVFDRLEIVSLSGRAHVTQAWVVVNVTQKSKMPTSTSPFEVYCLSDAAIVFTCLPNNLYTGEGSICRT